MNSGACMDVQEPKYLNFDEALCNRKTEELVYKYLRSQAIYNVEKYVED